MPDELLPQPPPGVPAPPPGEVALRSRRKMRWIIVVGILSVAFVIGGYVFQEVQAEHRFRQKAAMITAMSDSKQICLALFDFDNQYGKYPDASTVALVKAQHSTTWTLSDSTSNDLFQQLFVVGVCQSEEIFYAKTPWSKKPDNNTTTEANTLASGECGFAYITGLSSKDDPDTPVCVAPLEPGKLTFDRDEYGGKAVILRNDLSAVPVTIDATGHAILNGMDLFDPRQPFWHGKAPNVKWPK